MRGVLGEYCRGAYFVSSVVLLYFYNILIFATLLTFYEESFFNCSW